MSGRRQSALPKEAAGPWADYANCLGLDPDLFFPERGESSLAVEEAKKVCAGCRVRESCLSYAMTPPIITTGVWGGMSAKERQRLRRKQRRAAS